jgi:hypothetical protein
VAEGAEITPSDPKLPELTVTPAKVAGLTIISRELADDSSPAAASQFHCRGAEGGVPLLDPLVSGSLRGS